MNRAAATGFTLIEILVVLLIVSIMSGVVIANLPSLTRTADFDAEVKRLQIVMELAREEALMQSSEFGFRLERQANGDYSGYSFVIYDDENQTWTGYDQRPLELHKLPEGIQLQLSVEGEGFRLNEEEDEGLPPVMLLSSGETTPFELTLFIGRDRTAKLSSDGYSRIERVDPDAE